MNIAGTLKNRIERDGYAIAGDFVSEAVLPLLRAEADRLLESSSKRGGVRNALAKSAPLREFATTGLPAEAAAAVLGPNARPVKLTVFDKTPRSNWKVPWHQDLTISVSERREVAGYGPWSVKDEVTHVQPPTSVLEQVLAIRVHLDDATESNGALRVLPCTHLLGRVSERQLMSLRERVSEVLCPVPLGGAMVMSPLLLHASSASSDPSRRRVLHFEFAACDLPDGLLWA